MLQAYVIADSPLFAPHCSAPKPPLTLPASSCPGSQAALKIAVQRPTAPIQPTQPVLTRLSHLHANPLLRLAIFFHQTIFLLLITPRCQQTLSFELLHQHTYLCNHTSEPDTATGHASIAVCLLPALHCQSRHQSSPAISSFYTASSSLYTAYYNGAGAAAHVHQHPASCNQPRSILRTPVRSTLSYLPSSMLTLYRHSDTPTSTTTSLSTLSTTAIKDGQRGHLPPGPSGRGHQHHPSTTSLEAERADRISRLAGLERVSTLRAPPQRQDSASSLSPQTTPTSTTGFPPNFPASHNLTPSYFDRNGQPVAVTKMSTVGTASATDSSNVGSRHTAADADADEDMRSSDTNYREAAGSIASTSGEADASVDDDLLASRSVGGYDDRMSDDGSASLVGFGEGANSTVSGPIYHRRPLPGSSSQGQSHQVPWIPERTVSGLSDLRQDQQEEESADHVSYAAEGGATIRGARHAAPPDDGDDLN